MKLHDLRPAAGAHTARTRVGRGISAGKGKTAGRGTKGQKARAGGSIPPWFEGGQTPLHMRIPKLRGFKNRFKIDYEVVNIGAIAAAAERGAFEGAEPAGGSKAKKAAPTTVNQDVLRAVGLVRTLSKPLKILGSGELSTPLFVVADAFTKSAKAKIEGSGGTVSVLEVPAASLPALGLLPDGTERAARVPRTAAGRAAAGRVVTARANRDAQALEDLAALPPERPAKAPKKASRDGDADATTEPEAKTAAEPEPKAKARAKAEPEPRAKARAKAEPETTAAEPEATAEPDEAPPAVEPPADSADAVAAGDGEPEATTSADDENA
jgi:large subunit ribosomal protein L15